MHPLCVACLCKGGKTQFLTEPALVRYYKDIVRDVRKSVADSIISPRLCRRCVTRLKRAMLFTKLVQKSYLILQTSLLKLDTKEFAILGKQLNHTPCSDVEQFDIPSDNGLLRTNKDEERPAPIITQIEGHAHSYTVPVIDDIQENNEAPVQDLIKMEVTDEDNNEDVPEEFNVVKEEVEEHHYTDEETFNNESNIFQDIATTSMSVKKEFIKIEPLDETETEAVYSCDGCNEAFTSRNGLKQHIADFNVRPHLGNQYEEKTCKQISQPTIESTSQRRPSAGYRPLIYRAIRSGPSIEASDRKTALHCMLCQKDFDSSSELDIHLSSHVSEKSSERSVCSRMFGSDYALRDHLRLHTEERPFKCSVCQKTFAIEKLLLDHMWTHSKDRPLFKCTTCQRAFATSSLWAAHVKIHTEVNAYLARYQCKICHKVFSTGGYLLRHTRVKHSILTNIHYYKPVLYRCDVCEKEFTSNYGLRGHMATHTGEKLYHCSVCQNRFSSIGHLRRHARIHSTTPRLLSID